MSVQPCRVWYNRRVQKLVGLVIGFVLLSLIFGLVERFVARHRNPPRERRTWVTDIAYWFFTPLVTRTITRGCLFAAGIVLVLIVGKEPVQATLAQGRPPIADLPPLAQAALALVVGDFLGYWVHRAFHGPRLWKFHAVHHSPRILDWLSASRVHPVNDIIARAAQAILLLGLGFPAKVLAAYVPFLAAYALLLHANVSWDFGPFRRVLVSPRFHRWHHTSEEEGLDKNFAGLLPIWDILFGTYYMPEGREPLEFGVADDIGDGLWSQLSYPFRRAPRG